MRKVNSGTGGGAARGMSAFYLAVAMFFAINAGITTTKQTIEDLSSIGTGGPTAQLEDQNSSSTFGAAAEGLTAAAFLFLYQHSRAGKNQVSIQQLTVVVPIGKFGSYSDAQVGKLFQETSRGLLTLLNRSLPDEIRRICQVMDIEISAVDGQMTIVVSYSLVELDGPTDIAKLVSQIISDYVKALFLEKLERVRREYSVSSIPNLQFTVDDVVQKQLDGK